MSKTRRAMNRKKRLELKLITMTVLCLLVVASFGKMKLLNKNESYRQKEELLLAEIAAEEERAEEIEDLKKYVQTKKYVEDVAKERLGLVYENEILFKAIE